MALSRRTTLDQSETYQYMYNHLDFSAFNLAVLIKSQMMSPEVSVRCTSFAFTSHLFNDDTERLNLQDESVQPSMQEGMRIELCFYEGSIYLCGVLPCTVIKGLRACC
jgi:hypothetical protein